MGFMLFVSVLSGLVYGKIFDGTGGYCWVPWADFGSWVFEFITWVMHCSGFSLYRELDLRFSWVRSVCCGRAMPSVVVCLRLDGVLYLKSFG